MKTRMNFMALCLLMLSGSAIAQKPAITTIDALGAGTGIGYGTEGIAISPAGEIAGFYAGYSNVMHAYVRTKEGRITTFDAPGAPSKVSGTPFPTFGASPGTYAVGIDASGSVTGYVIDAANVAHSYLREPDGAITEFKVPGAGTGPGQGTFAGNLSQSGTIAGSYTDASGMNHGFLRTRNGAVTEFDVKAAASGPGLGTTTAWAQCINPSGAITGYYMDNIGAVHGYVRAPGGIITTFDAPGAGTGAGQGTYTWAINPAGATAGVSLDLNNVYHGLLRAADGKITLFDVKGAGTGAGQGTQAMGIDPAGEVTGYYTDASGVSYGFLRAVDGKFTFFDAPGAGMDPVKAPSP